MSLFEGLSAVWTSLNPNVLAIWLIRLAPLIKGKRDTAVLISPGHCCQKCSKIKPLVAVSTGFF
jgi:hypothetical protein